MGVLLLAISAEDLAHDQEIQSVGIATGFVFQGLECRGGEGALVGKEEAARIGGKEVVELWLREAEVRLAFGRQWALPDLELRSLLGLEGDGKEFLVGESFESALEGGGGDICRSVEVVVADAASSINWQSEQSSVSRRNRETYRISEYTDRISRVYRVI